MSRSCIVEKNGIPVLDIEGREVPALAYMTYFEENNDYAAFAENGFELFTVSISLGDQPINAMTGVKPHLGGVFTKKGEPDYTVVDRSLRQIVAACPRACIFPRVYVCMPQWWIDEHPQETTAVSNRANCETLYATVEREEAPKRRESLYSQAFREDGARMLAELIAHIRESDYAEHVIGYHIAGGQTEEWFHMGVNGSYCENTLAYFNAYRQAKGEEPLAALPDIQKMYTDTAVDDAAVTEYIRFLSESLADTVAYLCRAAKAAVEHEQVIGVFYGYTWGVPHALWGTHALERLLDCPDIDFFSSPCAYWDNRMPGRDWPEQFPVDSVKLHGKMCFIEADVRTHLSTYPGWVRKAFDPDKRYEVPVFLGPPTEEVSAWVMRKTLARQLTYQHGMWWFDMFGHWYDSPGLMDEIRLSRRLYDRPQAGYDHQAQVALFVDEHIFSQIGFSHPFRRFACLMYDALGKIGTPIRYYLLSDIPHIDWERCGYRAALIMAPEKTGRIAEAEQFLTRRGVAVSCIGRPQTAAQLRAFVRDAGAFILCDSDDVVYAGNGYLAIHAATEGQKTIRLPETLWCTDPVSGRKQQTDRLTVDCRCFETRLYLVSKNDC